MLREKASSQCLVAPCLRSTEGERRECTRDVSESGRLEDRAAAEISTQKARVVAVAGADRIDRFNANPRDRFSLAIDLND